MATTGHLQWFVEEVIDASLDRTWEAVDDLSLIPRYHPVVRDVELPSGVSRRAPGVEYKCIVPTGRRRGWCVEKVIDHVPLQSTTVAFTADSWGLSKLIDNFVTEVAVEATEGTKTRVTLRGFYTPKGWRGRVFNALVIRRTMRMRARATLQGVKHLLEDKPAPKAMVADTRSANTASIPFHARVRIRTADPEKVTINGRLGYIAGKTEEPTDDGRYGYGVFVYDLARVWSCRETELEVTGKFDEHAMKVSEQHRLRLAAKNMG